MHAVGGSVDSPAVCKSDRCLWVGNQLSCLPPGESCVPLHSPDQTLQASLMRALAEMKLRTDPAAKLAVQQQYDLEDSDGSVGADNGKAADEDGVDEGRGEVDTEDDGSEDPSASSGSSGGRPRASRAATSAAGTTATARRLRGGRGLRAHAAAVVPLEVDEDSSSGSGGMEHGEGEGEEEEKEADGSAAPVLLTRRPPRRRAAPRRAFREGPPGGI